MVTEPKAWLTTFQRHGNLGEQFLSFMGAQCPLTSPLQTASSGAWRICSVMLTRPYGDPSSTGPGFEAWGKLQTSLHSLLSFA